MCDGTLSCGTDLAESSVECRLQIVQLATSWLLERYDLDTLDAGVSEVGGGVNPGQNVFEPGCVIGVGAVDGEWAPAAATSPSSVAATWIFIPAISSFAEKRSGMCFQSQVGAMVPSTSAVRRRGRRAGQG
jgi:hypothetical protein